MRAVIRRFHSPDALDLDRYSPADPEDDAVLIQMIVASEGVPGEESFDVLVCTVRWVARLVREGGPLVGRHHLIVDRMDIREVCDFLAELVESESGATWGELATRIGRTGKWEFEDYHP